MRRLALALAAFALLAPLASADHVYSHRYLLEGRLVGGDGAPLPGRTVAFFSKGDDFLEPCRDGHRPVTDERGDFSFCFHKHDLVPGTEVGVSYGGARTGRTLDATLRRDVLVLKADEPGDAPPGWNETFLVEGRAWRKGAQTLEGVAVHGATLDRVQVNVTLRGPDGAGSVLQVETDGFGDYRAPVRLLEGMRAQDMMVEVEVQGHRRATLLDASTHRVTLDLRLPSPLEAADEAGSPFPSPGQPGRPGQSAPRVSPALVLAGLAALGVSVALTLRKAR